MKPFAILSTTGSSTLPQMVAEAREQSKARPLAIELLIFVGVFIVSSILEFILITIGIALYIFISIATGAMDPANISQDTAFALLNNQGGTILQLFATIGIIAAGIIYTRLIERRKLPTLGFRKGGVLPKYLVGMAVGALMFSLAVGLCCLTGSLSFNGINPHIAWGLLIVFLLGFMIQGMSEELLCRGYFLVSLARKQTILIAIVISSIFFSLLHCMNPGVTPLAFFNLFLFGTFAAVYFLKSGDIWGVAALHTTWNFVQGNVFGISVSGMEGLPSIFSFTPSAQGSTLINGGGFGLEGGLAVTLVLVAGILIMLRFWGRSNALEVSSARQVSPASSEADCAPMPSESPERN